jgi:hypothetical protein
MFIAMAIFSSLVALGTNLSVPYVKVNAGLQK